MGGHLLRTSYASGDLPPDTTIPPRCHCVAVETGDKIGQFRQGLDSALRDADVPPNNWPEQTAGRGSTTSSSDYDFANDPRYVTLIITDYGGVPGSGNNQAVPVKYFAGFYVTGWDMVGNVPKPCARQRPASLVRRDLSRSLDNGDVWGHFVNIVVFSSHGHGQRRPLQLRRGRQLHRGPRRMSEPQISIALRCTAQERARTSGVRKQGGCPQHGRVTVISPPHLERCDAARLGAAETNVGRGDRTGFSEPPFMRGDCGGGMEVWMVIVASAASFLFLVVWITK